MQILFHAFAHWNISKGLSISRPLDLFLVSGPVTGTRLLSPSLYLPVLASNLYLPVLTPNLYLPPLVPNLYLPALGPHFFYQPYISFCVYQPWTPIWVYRPDPKFVFTSSILISKGLTVCKSRFSVFPKCSRCTQFHPITKIKLPFYNTAAFFLVI